jgi:hypothetical protein
MDRRSFGVKVAAGAAVAWVAPTVISVRAAEAATCPPPPASPPVLVTGTNTLFIVPGPSASTADLQDNTNTVVFAESGPLTLGTVLAIDQDGTPGTYGPPFAGATLPDTDVVYSYLVHARRTSTAGPGTYIGSLQVPPSLVVLGFAATTNASHTGTLEGTDGLGRGDMTYLSATVDGEGLEGTDSITIGTPDASGTLVQWQLTTADPFSDDFRLLLGPAAC